MVSEQKDKCEWQTVKIELCSIIFCQWKAVVPAGDNPFIYIPFLGGEDWFSKTLHDLLEIKQCNVFLEKKGFILSITK